MPDEHGAPPGIIRRFVGGLFAPIRGLRFLLAHPRLLAYAAFPTLINIVLVLAVFFVGMHLSESLADRIIPAQDQWYWVVLSHAIQIMLVVALVLFGALVFYILAGIICVPV